MYYSTLFSDILKPLDRFKIKELTAKHQSDRYSKSFGSWQHLISMLFCQFSGVSSLREAETAYANQASSRYHLRLPSLKRSTLSQANNRRSPDFFKDIAIDVLQYCRKKANKELASVLRLIDSSP